MRGHPKPPKNFSQPHQNPVDIGSVTAHNYAMQQLRFLEKISRHLRAMSLMIEEEVKRIASQNNR